MTLAQLWASPWQKPNAPAARTDTGRVDQEELRDKGGRSYGKTIIRNCGLAHLLGHKHCLTLHNSFNSKAGSLPKSLKLNPNACVCFNGSRTVQLACHHLEAAHNARIELFGHSAKPVESSGVCPYYVALGFLSTDWPWCSHRTGHEDPSGSRVESQVALAFAQLLLRPSIFHTCKRQTARPASQSLRLGIVPQKHNPSGFLFGLGFHTQSV